MTSGTVLKLGIVALCWGLFGCEGAVSFADDVQPIFAEYCAECHRQTGEGIATSGFSVGDYDSIMKGTKFGPVVIPGSSDSSALYLVVAQKTAPEIQMPPHHDRSFAEGRGAPLSDSQVDTIKRWIDQGAKNN